MGGQQGVKFSSDPSGAKISVYDNNDGGRLLFVDKVPVTLTLERGSGYMKAASYKVVVESAGFAAKEINIKGSIDSGWYLLGNIFFGNLLGWLVIDPVSGAMWNLPSSVTVAFSSEKVSQASEMKVVLVDSVSAQVLANAVQIN